MTDSFQKLHKIFTNCRQTNRGNQKVLTRGRTDHFSNYFLTLTVNFHLWPLPLNFTCIMSRWISMPEVRGHSVQKLLSRNTHTHTHTHTHTGPICSTSTTKVVSTVKNNLLVKGSTWPNCMSKTPASEYNLSVVQIYTVKLHRQELYRV